MSLSIRVARNTIYQFAGKAIGTAIALLSISILARYLGQAGFGQYTIIMTFLSFFGILADLGLTLVTTQMISQPGVDQDKALSNLFTLRLLSAVLFLGLAPLVVFLFPYPWIVKIGVMATSLSFFFIALNQILTGLFQKELRMDKMSLAEVISRLGLLAGVLAVVFFDFGLLGILAVSSFSSAVHFFLALRFSRPLAKIRLSFDKAEWRLILDKAWPLAVTIVFNLLYLKTDTLILSLVRSEAEVGIYGAAYKVIDILVTLPFMFAGLILPILSAVWAEGDREKFRNVFQKSFDAMVVAAVPMMVGMQYVATKTMSLVAGQEFAVSGPVLRILILAASIIFLGTIFSHAVIAVNGQKKLIAGYVFTGLTALAGYLVFIPRYSLYGAAWVTIYSEAAIFFFTLYVFWKYAGVRTDLSVFGKSLLASTAMAAVLYWAKGACDNLAFLLAVGTTSYLLILYLIKGLEFISFREVFGRAG